MQGNEDFGEIVDSLKEQFKGPTRRQMSGFAIALIVIPVLIFLFNAFVVVGAGERA